MQSVCFTSAEQVLHVGVSHQNAEKPAQADGLGVHGEDIKPARKDEINPSKVLSRN